MRYENRATLVKEFAKEYNPDTGKSEAPAPVNYDTVPCNISPLSAERTALDFGDVARDINIIRLNNRFDKYVTHAYVDGTKYLIVKHVKYRRDTSLFVEQVN